MQKTAVNIINLCRFDVPN